MVISWNWTSSSSSLFVPECRNSLHLMSSRWHLCRKTLSYISFVTKPYPLWTRVCVFSEMPPPAVSVCPSLFLRSSSLRDGTSSPRQRQNLAVARFPEKGTFSFSGVHGGFKISRKSCQSKHNEPEHVCIESSVKILIQILPHTIFGHWEWEGLNNSQDFIVQQIVKKLYKAKKKRWKCNQGEIMRRVNIKEPSLCLKDTSADQDNTTVLVLVWRSQRELWKSRLHCWGKASFQDFLTHGG